MLRRAGKRRFGLGTRAALWVPQGREAEVKVLTSFPSCLQGLAKFDHDTGTQADYIVVEMARRLLGENWISEFVRKANGGGIERVLL